MKIKISLHVKRKKKKKKKKSKNILSHSMFIIKKYNPLVQ